MRHPTTPGPYALERAAHAQPVPITISTKVPSKWRFVDLETGDVWAWDETPAEGRRGHFRRVSKLPVALTSA